MKQMFDDYYKCFGSGDETPTTDNGATDIGTGTKPDNADNNTYTDTKNDSTQNNLSCNACVVNRIGYAQAYVPNQTDTAMYDAQNGLKNGTAYTALNMPYNRGTNLKLFGGEAM